MRKFVRFVVLPLAGIAAVSAALVVYFALTFDPNQYKPKIEQAVKDRTQRTLKLEGDVKLSFFPDIGARLGKASLSERGGETEFAAAEDFHVALKLRPLLSKRVVIDAIEATNLRANVIRYKDGTTNIADLTGGADRPTPADQGDGDQVRVDISHVTVKNATVTFTDQAAGTIYVLSTLDLKTGRIARGVPTRIDLSLRARSDKPRLDLETKLKGALSFDLEQRRYALTGFDLAVKGLAAGIDNLAATAQGDLDAQVASGELTLARFAVAASGRPGGGELNAKLDVPRLILTAERVTADQIKLDTVFTRAASKLNAKLDVPRLILTAERVSADQVKLDTVFTQAKSKLNAKLDIPGIEGDAQSLIAGQVNASIDLQQEGATTKVSLSSPLAVSAKARRIELSRLAANISVNNPGLLKKPIAAKVNGAAQIDLARENASLVFTGRLDDSTVKGTAGLARFLPPFYTFDLTIDQLDADRYLPAARREPDRPLDLSVLKSLDASGSVRIGTLTMANVKANNVRFEVKAAKRSGGAGGPAANLHRSPADAVAFLRAPATAVARLMSPYAF